MDPQDLKELLRTAKHGDIVSFKSMLNYDPLLLDKVDLLSRPDTPLHIAAMSGRTKFVKEVVLRKPSFAWDLNQAGLSPLHIASALGHQEIAKELLKLGPDLCLLQDDKGQTALHHAAIKGRVEIIKELLEHRPDALNEVTAGGDTAFHLAIKSRQRAVLRVLLDKLGDKRELLDKKNKQGFTVSQLAGSRNLVSELEMLNTERVIDIIPEEESRSGKIGSILGRIIRKSYGFENEAIQVIAVLLVTVTYQGALTPPASIWKESMKLDYKCLLRYPYRMYPSLHSPPAGDCPTLSFLSFMFFNTFGFFCSLMLLLLFKHGSSAQILMVLSLASLMMSYTVLLYAICPDVILYLIFAAPAVPLVLLLVVYPIRKLFARISTFWPTKPTN